MEQQGKRSRTFGNFRGQDKILFACDVVNVNTKLNNVSSKLLVTSEKINLHFQNIIEDGTVPVQPGEILNFHCLVRIEDLKLRKVMDDLKVTASMSLHLHFFTLTSRAKIWYQ